VQGEDPIATIARLFQASHCDINRLLVMKRILEMNKLLMTGALALGLAFPAFSSAGAVTVTVQSAANSTGGGIGLATGVFLTAGQNFTVTANPLDTWSLGSNDPCTRESNADGLTACYGTYSQNGLIALYGSLVGQIGSGSFFLLGSNFSGPATGTGQLFLYNFDSNTGDNSGEIVANISAVPVPPALALLGTGLIGLGALARKKKKIAV
jgi:hypothetical protein